MPLPQPKSNESKTDFVDRCMSDKFSKEEFKDVNQRYAVCMRLYDGEKGLLESMNDQVSKKVEEGLQGKLKEHREKVGDDKRKQTTLRKLKIVFNRGVGAYRTNPSSVRPNVSSPEQWAYARVNSFLRALRNLKYGGGKHDTDLLPQNHPAKPKKADSHRQYPDGEAIPSELPPAYRKSEDEGETKGQACVNCNFYKENTNEARFYCTKFKAPVRPQYWCKAWKGNVEALQETYNDYPESATNNAKKVLRWREEHGDEVKGMTAVGWTRANQLAKKEKISRETVARMASFKRHQKNADIDPDFKATPWKDAGYVAWLGWGGTSGVNWAINKLQQIDKKANIKMAKELNFSTRNIESSKVDTEAGILKDVSLISEGIALGHELYVDSRSLETIFNAIEGKKLPAYITHNGALTDDRITREIGFFENFKIDEKRILGDFNAFDSFRDDDKSTFNRLFELAEKIPENFGLSIVFSADIVWATEEGDLPLEVEPDHKLYDYPSIRVNEVSSADFVDSPASNEKGLFSQIDNNINNMENTDTLSSDSLKSKDEEELEKKEELGGNYKENLEGHEDEKLGDDKEELGGHEEDELESKDEELSLEVEKMKKELEEKELKIKELEEKLAEKDEEKLKREEEMKSKEKELSSLDKELKLLSSLIKGTEPVETALSQENETWKPSRDQMIKTFAKENNISEFTATLKLGRKHPELFNN